MFGKKKRILRAIRSQWGQTIVRKRDFDLISSFHKIRNYSNDFIVDDTTWSDLSMDELFTRMDRTVSPIGSQYLYHMLHKYEFDRDKLKKRFNIYQFYINNQDYRESIQVILKNLERRNAYYLSDLLFNKIPDRPKHYSIFYLLSITSIICIAVLFFYPPIIFFAFIVFITNLIVENRFNRKISSYITDLSVLSEMLRSANKFAKLETKVKQIENLKSLKDISYKLLKKIGWLTIDKTQLDELSAMLIDYLNHFCLFNLCAFVRAIHFLKQYRLELQTIFETIGSLDAEIAMASYLEENKKHCVPSFNKSKSIQLKNIFHPLLENPIANSLKLKNNSCLVTGSNMAGKTTFIKTMGINVILALTLGFAHAEKMDVPQLIVHSTIKRSDDLSEHKSYYFKEIEAILDFINLNKESHEHLFLIDEIFRGTNTVERISAATSVLKYLARQSFIFVTTHDIELQELLKDTFEMYHFSEQVENGNFYFDYKIKKGPCSNRNAIKLLELKGYPDEITSQAMEISKTIFTYVDLKGDNDPNS